MHDGRALRDAPRVFVMSESGHSESNPPWTAGFQDRRE